MSFQPYRCPGCPTMPVVSTLLGAKVLQRLPPKKRAACLERAMAWLLEKHEGLSAHGFKGHPYTNKEKDTIGAESGIVAGLPCPFFTTEENGCVMGGLGPRFTPQHEAGKAPYCWLPNLVAITFARDQVRDLTDKGQIADVKVALLSRNRTFYTPADVEFMRASKT